MALYLVSILCIAVLFSFAAAFRGVREGGKNVWCRKASVRQVWLAVVGGRACTSILPSWSSEWHSRKVNTLHHTRRRAEGEEAC
jgi:hypothetical protein